MTIENARDVIDHVIAFHQLIGDYYATLSGDCTNQRVKLLLDYLIVHEKKLQEGLAEFEVKGSHTVLDAWLKFSTCSEQFKQLKSNFNLVELTVENVAELCNSLYDCVIDQFETLAKQAEVDSVKNVFLNIAQMERKEQLRMSRNVQQLQDL